MLILFIPPLDGVSYIVFISFDPTVLLISSASSVSNVLLSLSITFSKAIPNLSSTLDCRFIILSFWQYVSNTTQLEASLANSNCLCPSGLSLKTSYQYHFGYCTNSNSSLKKIKDFLPLVRSNTRTSLISELIVNAIFIVYQLTCSKDDTIKNLCLGAADLWTGRLWK